MEGNRASEFPLFSQDVFSLVHVNSDPSVSPFINDTDGLCKRDFRSVGRGKPD